MEKPCYLQLAGLVLYVACAAMAQESRPATAPSSQPAASSQPAETDDPEAEERPAVTEEPYDIRTAAHVTSDWGGVRADLEDAGLILKLRYQNQFQKNFRGGLQTHHGHRSSGTYDLGITLDLEKMGLIEGGSIYVKAKGGYSDGINPDKVGALNNTNADAFDDIAIFVRKWWYKQRLLDGKVELLAGRYTTRKDIIDRSLYARHEDYDFLNQSSMRNRTIPHRNGIGAYAILRPAEGFYFTAATIDADAERTETGFKTAFHDDPNYVGYWEGGFTPKWASAEGPMPGKYRIGWWYDATSKTVFSSGRTRSGDLGFYLGLDQRVYKENDDPDDAQGLGLFARYGHASRDINQISDYWQIGFSYLGLLPDRDQDVFGLSVSQSILSREYRCHVNRAADRETVYELYYKWNVTPWLNISPNLQVITRAGGTEDDDDALVGGLRVQVIF